MQGSGSRTASDRSGVAHGVALYSVLAAICLSLTFGLAGCFDGCGSEADAQAWFEAAPAMDRLPERADGVLAVRTLRDLAESARFVQQRMRSEDVTRASPLHRLGHAFPWTTSAEAPVVEQLDRAGLDLDAPAVVFDIDGSPGVGVRLTGASTLQTRLNELEQAERGPNPTQKYPLRWRLTLGADSPDSGSETPDVGGDVSSVEGTEEPESTSPLALDIYVFRGSAVAIWSTEAAGPTPAWLNPGSGEPEGGRWVDDEAKLGLMTQAAGPDVRAVGVVHPSRWVKRLTGSARGHAAALYDRVARHSGPVGLGVRWEDGSRTLKVDMKGTGNPGEPSPIENLGRASGELPALGGLIEPGVLGVLRLSVDPQKTYQLLRSALPAEQRRRIDAFWKQLEAEVQLSGPKELFELWTGHAVIVGFGVDAEALRASGAELVRRVLSMEATREVILLPIRHRNRLERTLDIVTQLSQGQLSRQKVRDAVQYAWFEEGVLRWAMILADDHAILVDSATALDRAKAYERRGRPLGEEAETMGIEPLLAQPTTSGLYLDAATLSNLLTANGLDEGAAWLVPFQSFTLTSDVDDDETRTELKIRLDE